MIALSADRIRELMDTPENIRNVSVIACLNHKKSTISDILLSKVE